MTVKPSIRNMAATAQDFVTFSNTVTKAEGVNISPDLSKKLSDLAGRFETAIENAAASREGVRTLNLHAEWQKENAPSLSSLAREAKTLLTENSRALKSFVAGEVKGSEWGRIRAEKLENAFSSIIRAESEGGQRDAGAYWEAPLRGIVPTPVQ